MADLEIGGAASSRFASFGGKRTNLVTSIHIRSSEAETEWWSEWQQRQWHLRW